ncbi:MFS transporter [Beduinella massiliensis]|uniref:MFS transporter n=1 Tax=Beduinella massiliensis TaxID=1852363 RepID=UPI0031F9063F
MLKHFTREEKSWIFYDWANSAQSAIIAAIILPIFFKTVAKGSGVADVDATAYWGYATSIGTLLCAVCAPFLGALGDLRGYKKKLFTFFLLVGVAGTALLAFTGNWKLMLAFYILSTLGFNGSCVFYDGFLNDVTTAERMDKVSTYGYGLGYIGGSTIPLVAALLLIQFGEKIGISAELATRFSFLLTAVWWLGFTVPMLKNVQQRFYVEREGNLFHQTFERMGRTLRDIAGHRAVLMFLIAYFFYIDGVGTIIHMATVFGDSCHLGSMDMMLVLLIVQIVAFPFAILYGKLASRLGARTMILVGIATYLLVCVVGFRLATLRDFLVLAVLVGTAQGGIQALSRSFFGKIIPQERSNEFFGFFDVFGKFSAVVGPALFGVVAQATGVANYGVLAVMAMFVVGGVILLVCVPRSMERIG